MTKAKTLYDEAREADKLASMYEEKAKSGQPRFRNQNRYTAEKLRKEAADLRQKAGDAIAERSPARDTSQQAFETIKPHITPLEQKVLDALKQHGPLTNTEIAEKSGARYSSIQPRSGALAKKDRGPQVYDTGRRRPHPETGNPEIVWALTLREQVRRAL